jgi:hypothetical protein
LTPGSWSSVVVSPEKPCELNTSARAGAAASVTPARRRPASAGRKDEAMVRFP